MLEKIRNIGSSPKIELLETGASVKFIGLSNEKLPTAVIAHGWGSNTYIEDGGYDKLAETFRGAGYHTLQLAFRGHEGAEGDKESVTRAQNEDDIISAFEYLKNKPEVDMSKVLACGTSYGGYLMSILSDKLPIKSLILRAPALYPDEGWNEPAQNAIDSPDLMAWRKTSHLPNDNLALSGINKYKGELFIISSEFDEDIPKETRDSYISSAKNVKNFTEETMVGATHALSEDKDKEIFRALVKDWITSHY